MVNYARPGAGCRKKISVDFNISEAVPGADALSRTMLADGLRRVFKQARNPYVPPALQPIPRFIVVSSLPLPNRQVCLCPADVNANDIRLLLTSARSGCVRIATRRGSSALFVRKNMLKKLRSVYRR
jgi:hypothetical protein